MPSSSPLFTFLLFSLLALANTAHSIDPRLENIQDYTYLLQVDDTPMETIAATDFDLVVMDYSRDGTADTELTTSDIATLKNSGKVVLGYLSIGQAEDYRYYWQPSWKQTPPVWLGRDDPNWRGNYFVHYWDDHWKSILYGTISGPDKSYLDRIIDQGFDGIYLDIVDAYYYWSTIKGPDKISRTEARQRMVDLVKELRHYARVIRGKSDFLIFPQNAQEIIYDDEGNLDALGQEYLDAIDGLGNEDVWYNGAKKQSKKNRQYVLDLLQIYRVNGFGRLVLDVDYILKSTSGKPKKADIKRYNDFKRLAIEAGIISYASNKNRELNELVIIHADDKYQYDQP